MESSRLFKTLGDSTRILVFRLLLRHELNVRDIAATLGMGQPRISGHLRVLKSCGLVASRRCGKFVLYKACQDDGPAGRFIDMVRDYFGVDEGMIPDCSRMTHMQDGIKY